MSNRNFRAWAALAVTAALFATMGQSCFPRPVRGPDVAVTAAPTSGVNSVNVTLTATVTGGATPYTYAWTASPATTITGADTANASATVTATTVFTCLVTDDNARTDSASVTVTVTPAITVTASGPPSALGGESVNLNALVANESGAVSFQWLVTAFGSAGGVTLVGQTSQTPVATFTADAAGTFTFRVTATDAVSTDSDTVSIAVTPSGAGAATTFTIGTDNLTGTTGNDIFEAKLFYNQYTDTWIQTLQNADRADGLAGDDVLNAEMSANANPTITNIETFNITATANVIYNASKTTGLATLNNINSTGKLTASNLAAIPDIAIANTDQDMEVSFAAAAVEGSADALGIWLGEFDGGTFTNATGGIETYAIESTGAVANAVTLVTTSDAEAVVVTGDQDLDVGTLEDGIESLDASAFTGNLTAILPDQTGDELEILGGSGDDDVESQGAGDTVTADMGAGDDRLTVAGFTDGTDELDGGAGTDTVVMPSADAGAVAAAVTTLANFEALELSNALADNINLTYFTGVTDLVLAAGISASRTLTMATGRTVTFEAADGGANTLGITIGGTGTSDAVSLVLDDAGTAVGGLTTFTGVESASIESIGGANTMTGLTFNPSAGVANASLTITGDENLTLGTVTLATPISASAFEGNLSLTLAQAGAVTGGNGDDTIIGSGGADSLGGGAGDDTLTGNAGNDAISGGEGDDTIRGGAGADSLTGGAGADTFVFEADAATNGDDTINDFTTDDVLDLNTNAGFDQAIAATVADTSTAATAWDDLNVLVVTDADGSIDTAAEVAALFGAGAPFENPANGDAVAVIIQGNADTTVWFCVEGDADADFAAGECAQVATLVGFTGTLEDENVGG